MVEAATKWSPAVQMFRTASRLAACPLVVHSALQRRDFLFHRRDGGVGDAGIHVAVRRKVEQLADVLGGIIGVGGALVDRQGLRLAVAGLVAAAQGKGFQLHKLTSRWIR